MHSDYKTLGRGLGKVAKALDPMPHKRKEVEGRKSAVGPVWCCPELLDSTVSLRNEQLVVIGFRKLVG